MQRKIIHIDMDCFYASIEMRRHPEYRDIPMAVGGTAEERGVLCTCNYPARKFGIHSAMATFQAFKKYPKLILLPVDMRTYHAESAEIFKIFKRYTTRIEGLSLDEAFLDVTGSDTCNGSASLIAEEIRNTIKTERKGLTASAGIAPNKFLAKVASDWEKPDGQFTINPNEVAEFTKALPLGKIPGVGEVLEKKMQSLGFQLCRDILPLSRPELVYHFGSFGDTLYDLVRGIDERPVSKDRTRKSISTENTFPKDIQGNDCLNELRTEYFDFLKRAHKFIETENKKTYPVFHCFVKIKYADFKTTTIERAFNDVSFKRFELLFKERYDTRKMVRLLGVGIHLDEIQSEKDDVQMTLF
ncbi:MAG: DNA polymerase IV [Fibrobacteraceae bacterium]|nr:DNA polymerase IV [Fibrobacteraceae bacterium]